jgi:hypothetical protein
MGKENKSFKDTTFGKILGKAGDLVGDVPGIILKATVGGNPMGAVQDVIFSKVELEETKAYLGDVQNARNREIELAKSGKKDWFQIVVGMMGLIMLTFCLYVLVYVTIPIDNKTLFVHFIGIIEGVALSIYGYYFGSSKSSSDKTKMMSNK